MLKNTAICLLETRLEKNKYERAAIKRQLHKEYAKVFYSLPIINDFIRRLEESNEYRLNAHQEIERVCLIDELSNFDSCREYLEEYLGVKHGIYVDWASSSLVREEGESLLVYTGRGRNSGVWLGNKLVIKEEEYLSEEGVEIELRNLLIEKWMEQNGYYPGCFVADYTGEVYLLDTRRRTT